MSTKPVVFYNSEGDDTFQEFHKPNHYQFNERTRDEGQFYSQQRNQFSYGFYKNSEGKQFDENFKRNFVKSILKLTYGKDDVVANNIISKESEKIKVYTNEVSIWISIYKIVFDVEAERARRRLNDTDTQYLIQEKIIDYLNNHPNEKKYKFNRITNRVFRALGIKKCTGEYWLRELLIRFKQRLSPQINVNYLIRKLIKNERAREDTSDHLHEYDLPNYNDKGKRKDRGVGFIDFNMN